MMVLSPLPVVLIQVQYCYTCTRWVQFNFQKQFLISRVKFAQVSYILNEGRRWAPKRKLELQPTTFRCHIFINSDVLILQRCANVHVGNFIVCKSVKLLVFLTMSAGFLRPLLYVQTWSSKMTIWMNVCLRQSPPYSINSPEYPYCLYAWLQWSIQWQIWMQRLSQINYHDGPHQYLDDWRLGWYHCWFFHLLLPLEAPHYQLN